jgi:hypothetical protein
VTNRSYIVRLLRLLETSLVNGGHTRDADRVGRVVQRIAASDAIDQALETLYAIDGWEEFALRLIWYGGTDTDDTGDPFAKELLDYRVATLQGLLLREEPPRETTDAQPPVSGDLSHALIAFGVALDELRREAYDGETFIGIPHGRLEALLLDAERLRALATAESSRDIERFLTAFHTFLGYVLRHHLTGDVRVVNLIDNANLMLQTVIETVGAEDFDSLQQTIALLEQPQTFFEK